MEDIQVANPEQKNWYEKGNFFNESDPFRAGKEQHVYRARIEQLNADQYKLHLFEFRANSWELVEGWETTSPVDLATIEKIYEEKKINRIGPFQVHDFNDTPEEKANDTKEEIPEQQSTQEGKAQNLPKEQSKPSPSNQKSQTIEQKANATPKEKKDPNQSPVTPEARSGKSNEPPDSEAMLFAKSALRTIGLGMAIGAGAALVAIFSPFVAAGLGIGMLAKGIADSFLANANHALDTDQDVLSYDTVSGTISGALPIDIKSSIAVAYGFDPMTGEELSPQNRAMIGGNIVGGAVVAVVGTAAGIAGSQAIRANKSKTYFDKNLSKAETQSRMQRIDSTKKWADTLPASDKAIAKKIIADHENGQLYGIRKDDGTVLTLDQHDQKTAALDTLEKLFPEKAFGARNNGGRGYQSAHLAPASVMKQLPGYDKNKAMTALLPTKNRGSHGDMPLWSPDVHRRFDAGWKQFGMDKLKQNIKQVTAQEYMDATITAIKNTPHLSPTAKSDLAAKITSEFVKYTKGNLSMMLKIPENYSY